MAKRSNTKTSNASGARHKRIMIWSFVIILVGSVAMPFTGYFLADTPSVQAAATEDTNPRANYWRAVRDGGQGYTAASGPYTTNVLIENGGQNWRQLRNGPIASLTPWWLALVLLAIGAFYVLRGRIDLEQSTSGRSVERWTLPERVLHWYTASLFIILTITGLSLLFGRAALIPVIGLRGFSAYADFAIALHNYLGPFFVVGVFLEIIAWVKHNIPNEVDIEWIKRWGGMMGRGKHPRAGRMNGGEKIWFWIVATVGVAVCITGLILDFPNFDQSRGTMQLSNVIHSVLSVIWVSVAFGHIYIGTIGTEGALEGMTTGRVSAEWAKQHHDIWYEELERKGEVEVGRPSSRRPASPRTT